MTDIAPLAPAEVYLGSALHAGATRDGFMIRVVANKGTESEHIIWLEPSVYRALVEYAKQLWGDVS